MKRNLFYITLIAICLSFAVPAKSATLHSLNEGVHMADYELLPDPIFKDILKIKELVNKISEDLKAKKESMRNALVSWYGKKFHGRLTASGKPYDMNAMTAAHKKLPFGTKVKIINTRNNKEVVVTINDRGPYVGKREFDLSKAAFDEIADTDKGILNIKYEIL